MKPQTIWASVAVVFILISSATTLVILGKDVSVIMTLAALVALPVLGAFGVAIYHRLDQVREQGNGRESALLALQERGQIQMKDSSDKIFSAILGMQQKTLDQLTSLAIAVTPPPPVQTPVSPAPELEEPKPPEEHW